MRGFRIGMRWWLGLAFALIAALTAVAVAEVFSRRSAHAFQDRAQELAVGQAVSAADAVDRGFQHGNLNYTLDVLTSRRPISVFVFAGDGSLLSADTSRRVRYSSVPLHDQALLAALRGERFVASIENGRATVLGLPLRSGNALVAYVPRPELAAELGIVRDKIIEAASWAVVVGACAGLVVATLIAARLRRIARAAAAIEAGSFEQALAPGFGDELGSLAVTIDRMRERLRHSFAALESDRNRLERLLERLQEGVLAVDRDGRVAFANEQARTLLGGRPLAEGDELPEPFSDVSLRGLASALFGPGARPSQARVEPDDERVYLFVGIPAGEGDEALLVITDVTARERRERAEREFVANAAHELRTPLTTITAAVEVLQAGAKDDPEQRERFLAHIHRESGRLGRLVRALLVLARAQTRSEAPRLAPVPLRPLIDEVVSTLDPSDDVEVHVRCPPRLAALLERDLAEQALANLAANAVKYTRRGTVTISAREEADDQVVIEVSDTGAGIPRGVRDRIFDRFYRANGRDADGFGLGLAIVRQAVHAQGGTVDIESAPGRGTVVRVRVRGARSEVV